MTTPAFHVLDWVILGFILLQTLLGLKRGLSRELAGLFSLAAAVWVGWYYYEPLSAFILQKMEVSSQGAQVIALVGIVLLALVGLQILRLVLRHLMEFTFKGNIERVGGALAGLIKGVLVSAVVLLVLGLYPNDELHKVVAEDMVIGNRVLPYLVPAYEKLSEQYPVLKLPEKLDQQAEGAEMPELPRVLEEPLTIVDEADTNAPPAE